ncbi:MAG: hypothetical protein R6U70_02290 [Bacillota bacterium]
MSAGEQAWGVREITAVAVFARAAVDADEVVRVRPPHPAAGILDVRAVRHSLNAHLDGRHVLVEGTSNWRIEYVEARGSGEATSFTARENYRAHLPLTFDEFLTPVEGAEPEATLRSCGVDLRRTFLCADEDGRIGLALRIRGAVEVSGPVRLRVAVLARNGEAAPDPPK